MSKIIRTPRPPARPTSAPGPVEHIVEIVIFPGVHIERREPRKADQA